MPATGLAKGSCQSGAWILVGGLDSINTYNFTKNDMTLSCSGQAWNIWSSAGQQCYMHQKSINLKGDKIVSMSLSGVTGSETLSTVGSDINVFLYVDSELCGNNRFNTAGFQPTASASCTRKIEAGSHTLTFMMTSEDGSFTSSYIKLSGYLVFQ